MTETDLKVYFLNVSTLAISFAQIEAALKIALLILSIGYTAQRWYLMHKNKNNE
jgi:hypothetical protein